MREAIFYAHNWRQFTTQSLGEKKNLNCQACQLVSGGPAQAHISHHLTVVFTQRRSYTEET